MISQQRQDFYHFPARGIFAMPSIRFLSGICIIPLLLLLSGCAEQKSTFPAKPITIVVSWDAGGGTDALARSIALESSAPFGQVINVLNRPGGAGAVGHSFGAMARPDGYTVMMITYELCTYAPLGRMKLDTSHFRPIVQLNEDPAAITVHADSPWQTLEQFLQHARAHSGQVTIGNSGPGAVWHIGALKLEKLANARFTHVPHNGAKDAVTQLLGKHLDAVAVSPAEVLQYLQLGNLRCLGVMAEARMPQLPETPTFREQGIDLVHGTWRGLAVPLDTPDSVVQVLQTGFTQGFETPAFQETAEKAMLGLRYRNADQFLDFLNQEQHSVNELLTGSDLVIRSGNDVQRMPRLYGTLLFLCGLILAIRTWKNFKKTNKTPPEQSSSTSQKMALTAFCGLVVYGALMFTIGYLLSTLLFLVTAFVYLGERQPGRISTFSLGAVILIYVVFKTILDVPLPQLWG
ncbi:MAG: tripartite tricarboxylate transporter substrate-binding protein [bacterium]|nr:tripartite tricarboxylate transporter substrate-binding protein [bacterium]